MREPVSQEINNLQNGVSQQSPSLRRRSQCEAQENCRNDPVQGMGKRYCSELISEMTGLSDPENYIYHFIDRDELERYILAVTNGSVKAFDKKTGYQYTVKADADALGYLGARGDRPLSRTYQMLNTIDTTFLLNRTVPVQYLKPEETVEPPPETQERMVTIAIQRHPSPHADRSSGADIGTTHYQYYYRFNINGKDITYEDATAPTAVVTEWLADQIRIEQPTAIEVAAGLASVEVRLPAYDSLTVTGEWHTVTSGVQNRHNQGSCVTVNQRLGTVPTPSPAVKSALWYIKQADYATKYEVIINDTVVSITTPEATSEQARAGLQTTALTMQMRDAINALKDTHGCTATRFGNVLYITHLASEDFTILAHDDLGDRASYAIKEHVEEYEQLPPSAPIDYMVEIRGGPAVDVDPYHVRYRETDGDGNKTSGYWQETVKYGIPTRLDPRTMPLLISRKQDQLYKDQDNPLGIYFELEPAEWGERTVGDLRTAPFPSFCSEQDDDGKITKVRYIQSLTYHRNRLSVCSDENVLFSEAGSYLNFFPTTVITTIPSDPIDIALSLNSVAPVEHMLDTDNGLLLFAPKQQLLLSAGDVFSAETIKVDSVSRYDVDMSVAPVAQGSFVYFWSRNTKYSQLMEYAPQGEALKWIANSTAQHVPTYVAGRVQRTVGSSLEKMFVVPTRVDEGPTQKLYVYNYLWQGAEKVQSAWQTWTFAGRIVDVSIEQDELFMVVHYPDEGKTYLEKIVLSHDAIKEELGYPIFLDRREEVDLDFQLDAADPRTLFAHKGRYWVGFRYNQRYVFSQFYPRDNQARAITSGRLQLQHLSLTFNDTSTFKVTVERGGVEQSVKKYEGVTIGSLQSLLGEIPITSSTFRIPVGSRADRCAVTIENESEHDALFTAAEWQGVYSRITRRM